MVVVPAAALDAQAQTTAEIRALAQEAILSQPLLTRPNYFPRMSKDMPIPSISAQTPANCPGARLGPPG